MGILRRASERGKALPPQLEAALMAQAGITPQTAIRKEYLTAAFSAGAGKQAGGIGYSEQVAPTLKGSSGGNIMPTVLCLNDQGGGVMDCSEDMAGTLRAEYGVPARAQRSGSCGERRSSEMTPARRQAFRSATDAKRRLLARRCELSPLGGSEGYGACDADGHEPLVYENHGIAARYRGPLPVAPTLSAAAGTGGNNLSLVSQPIDSDTHLLYSRQRVDVFKDGKVASTQSARQHKDATDLVCQPVYQESPLLIRRLTPLECERLQGFPDGWTDLPHASDSARYRALGNSVAIPCVEYIMRGIAMAAGCRDGAHSRSRGH